MIFVSSFSHDLLKGLESLEKGTWNAKLVFVFAFFIFHFCNLHTSRLLRLDSFILFYPFFWRMSSHLADMKDVPFVFKDPPQCQFSKTCTFLFFMISASSCYTMTYNYANHFVLELCLFIRPFLSFLVITMDHKLDMIVVILCTSK